MTYTNEQKHYEYAGWMIENGIAQDVPAVANEEGTVFVIQENDGSNDPIEVPEEFTNIALMA